MLKAVSGYCRSRQRRVMANPQFDQLSSDLWWKLVPWLILVRRGSDVGRRDH